MPRLVLLPGMDGTGDLFAPFVQAIESHALTTVVRYSSPERRTYPECLAVARQCLPENEPYILVGESFSGPIAVWLAAESPSGLRGIVLVGSFVTSPTRTLTKLAPFVRMLPTHMLLGWMRDFALLGAWATPERSAQLSRVMTKVSPAATRTRLREIGTVDASAALAGIRVRILYLRATHDRLVPRSAAELIVSYAPHTRMVELNAPHMLLQCAPIECATAILQFARECP